MRHHLCVCGALSIVGLLGSAAAQEAKVTAVVAPGQVGLRIGDQPFAVFNHGPGLAKPYVYPLRAPGGHVVNALAPFDHKHHKGIWVGVEKVNGANFWGGKYQQQDAVEPAPAYERIETHHVDVKPLDNGAVALHVHNLWQGEGGQTVAHEKTVITTFPNRLMVYDITLTAAGKPVNFEDTKEGYFAVRVAPSMIAALDGKIVNAEGDEGEAACWGQASPWVDYSGPVDKKIMGVAMFDHPGNFRKSRYHVRAYGLFAVSPFGEKVYSKGQSDAPPISLQPGQSLSVKYGLFVHAGDVQAGKVAENYQKFLEWTK